MNLLCKNNNCGSVVIKLLINKFYDFTVETNIIKIIDESGEILYFWNNVTLSLNELYNNVRYLKGYSTDDLKYMASHYFYSVEETRNIKLNDILNETIV